MSIRENIKRISQEKNISFYKICKTGGVSFAYMSALINGKKNNPSIEMLKKISKALNVPIEELIKD